MDFKLRHYPISAWNTRTATPPSPLTAEEAKEKGRDLVMSAYGLAFQSQMTPWQHDFAGRIASELMAVRFLGESRLYALDCAVGQLNQSYEYVKGSLDRLRKVHAAGHELAYKKGYQQGQWDAKHSKDKS